MLAQAMWNSGPAMQRQQLGRGTSIPNFEGNEMAHIQAFIRSQGLREDRGVELLPLPDPAKGARLFRDKRCSACHASQGTGVGPDLTASAIHLTVAEISGVLWNHSYAMHDTMQATGIPFPRFEGGEMADLISYLHFLGFFRERGDPAKGASIFEERGCRQCHGGAVTTAPDLSQSDVVSDPIALSAAMWNHAPDMHRLMADQEVAWPQFDPGDMEHLAAYLRGTVASKGGGER
jgi:cytochrome c551/c552